MDSEEPYPVTQDTSGEGASRRGHGASSDGGQAEMTDTPTLAPEASAGRPATSLPRLARRLRARMEPMAAQIVHQIQEAVPEYASPVGAPRHQVLTVAAQTAARHFLDAAEHRPGQARHVDEMFRRLGYTQAQRGYSLESLEATLRAATRWSWHYLAEFAVDEDLSSADLRELAEAVFDYLEHLRAQLSEGFNLERRVGRLERDTARLRLFEMFLSDPPPRLGPGVALGIDAEVMRALAEAAEWPVPDEVVALAVSYYGEPPDVPSTAGLLIQVEPRRTLIVCPATSPDKLVKQISRSAPGLRVAVSWAVPPAEAGSALRWCQRALDLVQLGIIAPTPVVDCTEHATQLWLHAEPSMRRHLCQELLRPLLAETPNSRSILSETLLTWVETRDSAPAIAARLDVHPQTVRYRWKRINELFGESLSDPEFVVQMTLVLKSSVPLWKAGDQSDFDLFHDRAESAS